MPAEIAPDAQIAIVGAGLAGLRTAEALRRRGFAGSLVVIGDEIHPPYNRPPLSKEALAGGVEFEALKFRQKNSDLTWRLGSIAIGCTRKRSSSPMAPPFPTTDWSSPAESGPVICLCQGRSR